MKILFVGEGVHDLNRRDWTQDFGKADGVVAELLRRACPDAVGDESISVPWKSKALTVLSKKRGISPRVHKLQLAVEFAKRQNCAATVAVYDDDNREGRADALIDAGTEVTRSHPDHRVITGVAVRTIEAWCLGAVSALAEVAGVPADEIDRRRRKSPEDLDSDDSPSGKGSKTILDDIAKACGETKAHAEFRAEVARRTDVEELARNCPRGFGPFLRQVREKLCPPQ